jgi:hypothetical protein
MFYVIILPTPCHETPARGPGTLAGKERTLLASLNGFGGVAG